MNETDSVILSCSDIGKKNQTGEKKTTAKAARELLKNGILVETNKGLVCMSLNDALHRGVGGHNLSVEDFQTVATELLFQEEPEDIITEGVPLWTETMVKPKKTYKKTKGGTSKSVGVACDGFGSSQGSSLEDDFRETSLGFASLEYSFLDNVTEESEEVDIAGEEEEEEGTESGRTVVIGEVKKPVVRKRSLILKNGSQPVMSVGTMVKTLSGKSGKVNVSGATIHGPGIISRTCETASCEDTSDNSEVTSVADVRQEPEKPAKKRGGWPKGRKRKPEVKYEIRPPKAPATGYVIFLNEKRKDYRDMPFTEVTKLLGNEWSRLSLQEKKVYLDQAEIEKKRYREELKLYRQSDAYRTYLHKKRLKRLQGNGTEESDMDATDEIDDEDNEELYCRSCDQWFHSLHNKKEHLYGRQHLQSIAGRYTKMSDPDWCNPNMSSTSLDESSLDGSSYLKGTKDHCCTKDRDSSLNMDDAIVRFMVANKEREEERRILRKKLEESKARNHRLSSELQKLNETVESLTCMAESEKTTQILLEQRLFNLLNVPTLFYLPEPLSEDNN